MHKSYYRVLTIAGSDSGGCAGIQADLKTFSALKCFGMSAITALTAQNTIGVQSIFSLPEKFVAAQIESVVSDIGVDAIKIGMLERKEMVETVAAALRGLHCPIIVDPVMISTSGCVLLKSDAIQSLCEKLFPLATLITPNLLEAEYLSKIKIVTIEDMKKSALILSEYGAKNILIKGGHRNAKKCVDVLYDCVEKQFYYFSAKRIETQNTHGTGCTLSAAIAALCAKGKSVKQAVSIAKKYLTHALRAGKKYKIGSGAGPVKHL